MGLAEGLEGFKLYKRLNRDQKKTVSKILESVADIFDYIKIEFPEFTPHGIRHVFSTIGNAERLLVKLLPPKKSGISKDEAFVLILASIIHDIGMAPDSILNPEITTGNDESQENEELSQDNEKLSKDYRNELRKTHHIRSEAFVLDSPLFKDIEYSRRKAIALIAKGHRQTLLTGPEYTDGSTGFSNLPFLAAILRLADELEITYERVKFLDIFHKKDRFLQSLADESIEHWEAHLSLSSWEFSEEQELIIVKGLVKTHTGVRGVERVKEGLIRTIRETRNIRFGTKRILPIFLEFDLDFKEDLVSTKYEVAVDNDTVVDFLIDNIYNDNLVSIRELIQNAMDACKLRGQSSESWKPCIRVNLSPEKLVITDNGQGMDSYIIENYLTVAGCSYYKSEDFESFLKYKDYKPGVVGMFGIGIFSTFLLCDSFIIRTRFRERSPQEPTGWLETTLSRSFCPTYRITRPEDVFEYGTQIEVPLQKNLYSELRKKILHYVESNFQRPRVPLTVVMPDQEDAEIGLFPFDDLRISEQNKVEVTSDVFLVDYYLPDNIYFGIRLTESTFDVIYHDNEHSYVSRFFPLYRGTLCVEGVVLSPLPQEQVYDDMQDSVRKICSEIYSDKDIKTILDLPPGIIKPSIDRSSVVEGLDRVEQYLKDVIPTLVDSITRFYSLFDSEKKKDRFFDILMDVSAMPLTLMDNIMNNNTLGHIRLHSIFKEMIRIRDIDSKTPNEVDLSTSISLRKESWNILTSEKWSIHAPAIVVAKLVIPYLKERGFQFSFDDIDPQAIAWRYASWILSSFLPAEREKLIYQFGKELNQAPSGFTIWLGQKILECSWNDLFSMIENIEEKSSNLNLLLTIIYKARNESEKAKKIIGDLKVSDTFEDLFTIACGNAILGDLTKSVEFLEKSAAICENDSAAAYQMLFDLDWHPLLEELRESMKSKIDEIRTELEKIARVPENKYPIEYSKNVWKDLSKLS